jgi:murein DD-endopeptidase MepM/ murein hydrolase activator NlpD
MVATLLLVAAANIPSASADGQQDKNSVQSELDLAKASDAQVEASATQLARAAAAEQARLADATQAQAAAQQEADDAARSLAQVIAKTGEIKDRLARAAINEYIHPSASDGLMLLVNASSPDEAARRQAFAAAMSGETSATLEDLRGIKDDRAAAQKRLAAASALAAQRTKEQQERTQAAEEAAQQQQQAHLELQRRISDLTRQSEALVAADAESQALAAASVARPASAAKAAPQTFADATVPAAVAAARPVSSVGMIWPVNGIITSPFGPRAGGFHPGLDIGVPEGTPIAAAASGVVTFAGWNDGGYGNFVIIDNGGGISTAYAHQSQIAVSSGESVSQGETIGYVGTTGNSTGPHLHFEVRVNGTAVNPLNYLP